MHETWHVCLHSSIFARNRATPEDTEEGEGGEEASTGDYLGNQVLDISTEASELKSGVVYRFCGGEMKMLTNLKISLAWFQESGSNPLIKSVRMQNCSRSYIQGQIRQSDISTVAVRNAGLGKHCLRMVTACMDLLTTSHHIHKALIEVLCYVTDFFPYPL